MILGIDASNIRKGGGFTHLKEILLHAEPTRHGFKKVIIWSNNETLDGLPNFNWLEKRTHELLNKSFVSSFLYQKFFLSKLVAKENCDILFVPGGTFLGSYPNILSMSQNMLPFEKNESGRFNDFKSRLKFKLLHYTQKKTFQKSKGIIFLTNYARDFIKKSIKLTNDSVIIPHGINLDFLNIPKEQKNISEYSVESPYKLLYVSIVTVYKHQWNVAEAVMKLRKEGYPVTLDLVGSFIPDSLDRLLDVMKKDTDHCIEFKGEIPHDDLGEIYKNADAFVFASSCENMPIILVEAATSGLPIACSSMGPMPEVLLDAGFYFNPLDSQNIYKVLKKMIDLPKERETKAEKSYKKSLNYTWKDCSERTFEYFSKVAKNLNYENKR